MVPACLEPERKIHIELFAPHAPVQNPSEEVWLQGKRAVREYWVDLQAFQDVKAVFATTITAHPILHEELNWHGREALIACRRELGFQWE